MPYIWYSGATDVTGRTLQDKLGVDGGTTRPQNKKIVIGWGTKTKEDVALEGTVLNHPNNIRKARNKLEALKVMHAAIGGGIANFCDADQVNAKLANGQLTLPLVGRTKYHQSGKGFWLCLTDAHIKSAIADGAQYFQNYIDIDTEYRLHVCCGEVIYAVKKVENATEAGWVAQRKEKIMDYARKNNWNVNDATLDKILKILFKEVTIPDRIVRSNRRGWKFSSIKLENVKDNLKNIACDAVKALGLDFGAVDCALDGNGSAWVIEVNTGPGLQGTALEKWAEALKAKLDELQCPVAPPEPAPRPRQARQAANRAGRRDARGRFVAANAVGAAAAEEVLAPEVGELEGEGLAVVMRNVRNDAEARALLDALMKHK